MFSLKIDEILIYDTNAFLCSLDCYNDRAVLKNEFES